MLTIPQIEPLRDQNPYLYEALKRIIAAVNSLGTRLKMDPHPASAGDAGANLPPPAPPASIAVTGARGIFSVKLAAGAGNSSPIVYFIEVAADTAFATAVVYPLGESLVANIALGNVTRYFRARAKYIESNYSPYIYFGTQANPVGVLGSGVDPSTSDVLMKGSPVPFWSGGFSYTSTTSSITWSWSGLTLYRADGTTTAIPNGSQAVTGLAAGTTYFFYPYMAEGSTTVQWVTGTAGSPAIALTATGVTAAQQQGLQGRVPLSNGGMSAATTTSGTGGGSGGGRSGGPNGN